MKPPIEPAKLLYVTTQAEWRDWLAKHHRSEPEIWLVYYRKETGKPRIPYNDAVEEALCFGWIDSVVRSIDDERMAQRFSPRNPRTPYSQANKERLALLIGQGKVLPEVLVTIGDLDLEQFEVPADILEAIRADEQAWAHFQGFSPPYIRIRIAFIDAARNRPAEFEKRLRYFIQMTRKSKQFGFGGIEKYF
ncbi:MAG: YdeI/OmpD-associated family protein [Caldilineaceae bacterium]|nr:YdeI/OmpD-associated family protein [Caldilineaceae bacterium]